MKVERSLRLSSEERTALERDGYLTRTGVFGSEELSRISEVVEEVVEDVVRHKNSQGRARAGSYVFEMDTRRRAGIKWEGDSDVVLGIEPLAHLHPYFQELAMDPRLTEPMKDLVGEEAVSLFTDKLNLKRAKRAGPIALHQDYPYWAHVTPRVDQTFTAVIAIDEATTKNGALQVAPGSHLEGVVAGRESEDPGARREIAPESYDMSRMVSVELSAGSVLFFGPYLVHWSPPNRSDRDRRVLLYSYQPAGLPHAFESLRG